MVLHAPISSTAGVNLSKYWHTSCLFGIDTALPRKPSARKPFIASGNFSCVTSKAK